MREMLSRWMSGRRSVLRVLVAVLCCGVMTPLAATSALAGDLIADDALEAAIRRILRTKDGEAIKEDDLKNVYQITATRQGIKSLQGLEKCPNLALVNFSGNEISDIAPLAGHVDLQSADLSGNAIADVTPLTELKKLQYLQLDNNQVEDLTALKDLQQLRSLYLSGNKVESLEPLAGLSRLVSLYLARNKITDIGPLSGLKWLENLDLRDNQVGDVSPLSGLTELRFTFLQDNAIKDFEPLIDIARKDADGEKRFAPYWRLYVDGNPIDAAVRDRQVDELKSIGVRVNWKAKP